MRLSFFFLFVNISRIICQGQTLTPMFEMPIYFEDAVGNRDTLIIGYDTAAVLGQINTQFGELEVATAFDSVFDVRVVHDFDPQWRTLKRVVEGYEYFPESACGVSAVPKIMLNAKYPPVSIRWDTALLRATECNNNTVLTPDNHFWVIPNWTNSVLFYCMTNMNELVLEANYWMEYNPSFYLNHYFEVEGQGLQYIPGFYLIFRYDFYCQTVAAHEPAPTPPPHLYPNPAIGEDVTLALPPGMETTRIEIIDTPGRVAASWSGRYSSAVQLDIRSLPPGLYFVVAHGLRGAPYVTKLVRGGKE